MPVDTPKRTYLSVENLSLSRDTVPLFDNVNFSLSAGQIVWLRGENGSGKSTLLKTVLGLSPCDKGHIHWQAAKPCDCLFIGHRNAVKGDLTPRENLWFNADLFDGLHADAAAITNALYQVGLSAQEHLASKYLSAGQQRRLALSRLWLCCRAGEATHKPIWVLDEPLTALDTDFITRLTAQIAAHQALGGAVLLTSHQPLSLTTDTIDLSS